MEDNSVDYVILEQLGYHSTEKYLFPAVQKYEPYFPRVLHINNPFTSLHQFTAKPEPAWKNYQKGDYEKAIDIFSKELKLSKQSGDYYRSSYIYNKLGVIYNNVGDYESAMKYQTLSLDLREKIDDKFGVENTLRNIGIIYIALGNNNKANELLEKSLIINKEIGMGIPLETIIYLNLTKKYLNIAYDNKKISKLITHEIDFDFMTNYTLYQLLEIKYYLETAYNQVQELADNFEPYIKDKFLNYPIPKAIGEEWEKVK